MASNGNNKPQLPALTDDTLKELLSVQKQDIALRLEEVRRDSAEIAHNQSIAKQSIEAQERDRKHEREEVTKRQGSQQRFVALVVLALLAFSGFTIYIGQPSIVLDILKVVVGFAGGMGYQAYRAYKEDRDGE
jgi:hypothetical protein